MKAKTRSGYDVRTWDEGFDDSPLFVYCESLGPLGVVRAQTWEEAYECCQDEIMHGCTWDELEPEQRGDFERDGYSECVGHRSSGQPSNEGIHGEFYCEDPNGSELYGPLTVEQIAERFDILVDLEDEDELEEVSR